MLHLVHIWRQVKHAKIFRTRYNLVRTQNLTASRIIPVFAVISYWFSGVSGIVGIDVGNEGMEPGSAVFSICESKIDLDPALRDEGRTNAANMHNTTNDPASVHVAFSRKSAVLRTPIIWFDAAKLAANPPPLEFCTSTMRTKNTQTATMSMVINV